MLANAMLDGIDHIAGRLQLYHLSTIAFEMGPAAKSVVSSNGKLWIKNLQMEVGVQQSA